MNKAFIIIKIEKVMDRAKVKSIKYAGNGKIIMVKMAIMPKAKPMSARPSRDLKLGKTDTFGMPPDSKDAAALPTGVGICALLAVLGSVAVISLIRLYLFKSSI